MNRHRSIAVIAVLLASAALVGACGGGTGSLGSVPVPSSQPDPSVALGSPDVVPSPSSEPSAVPSGAPTASDPDVSPVPTPAPSGTVIVRAYFWLGGQPGSEGLVAVLREVSGTRAVATAAVNALLAGPTDAESSRSITSAVPAGSQLLGITIVDGVATVNLSREFESGGGSASVLTRLAQVVYTLTQFPKVDSVVFQIEGQPSTTFSSEGIVLDKPVGRGDYVALLPSIWVDRPAWGAAIGNPAHVSGNADVFEATFRISIIDGGGKTVADQQVMASCGTGCRGTFDTTIPYTVAKAQYGILRVYDLSAKDGTPEAVRDYRVWLTSKS